MDRLPARSRWLRRRSWLAARRDGVGDAVRIAAEVVDALHYAHAHNVIHRDVKPSNVLLASPNNTALLADFGVAFVAEDPAQTVDSALVGTAAYMSPEQALGEAVDGRSDLYAARRDAVRARVRPPAVSGATMAALIAEHLVRTPPVPIDLNPAGLCWAEPPDPSVPEQATRGPALIRGRRRNDLARAAGIHREEGVSAPPASRDPIPAALSRRPSRPFVGRREALIRTPNAWRRAATERPHLAVLAVRRVSGRRAWPRHSRVCIRGRGTVLYGRWTRIRSSATSLSSKRCVS